MRSRVINSLETMALQLKRVSIVPRCIVRPVVDVALYPSDVLKVFTSFEQRFGRHPSVMRPRTFNDWLQYSKLFQRRRRYTEFADKLRVRNFVKSRIGAEVLPDVYWTGRDLRDARFVELPRRFVIKANNGSGTNLIVTDSALLDWELAISKAESWLANDHSIYLAEWQYRWIEPTLLIEEYLTDGTGAPPYDYKFFCFNGRVRCIQVDFDRFTRHTRNFYTTDFELLPFGLEYPQYEESLKAPKLLEQMCSIAECLSKGERFLRVDLYDLGARVVFGELTLHPEAGLGRFCPPEWESQFYHWLMEA